MSALDAREEAEVYQEEAEEKSDAAIDEVAKELVIDDDAKKVGATSIVVKIDEDDKPNEVTKNGNRVLTGLHKHIETGHSIGGRSATGNQLARPAVEERNLLIGAQYDSDNDSARIALISKYRGTESIMAYSIKGESGRSNAPELNAGSRDNTIDDEGDQPLMEATDSFFNSGDGIDQSDEISANASPKTNVFYYTKGSKKHYVYPSEYDSESGKVAKYQPIITVKAEMPKAIPYSYIEFGVWVDLDKPDKDGTQKLSDLGISFVNMLGEEKLTSPMPLIGRADYYGNWVATVQEADAEGKGGIQIRQGRASVGAQFEEGKVTVALNDDPENKGSDFVKLTGNITGNEFSGNDKVDVTTNGLGLTEESFDGEFKGLFFGNGPKKVAREVGGVFDYATENNKGGAFRGAFGGKR